MLVALDLVILGSLAVDNTSVVSGTSDCTVQGDIPRSSKLTQKIGGYGTENMLHLPLK
jgi:hypothetical protein